jgi:hypothetical protein
MIGIPVLAILRSTLRMTRDLVRMTRDLDQDDEDKHNTELMKAVYYVQADRNALFVF